MPVNVWVFGDTVGLTTRVARWNGSRWASFRFPGQVRTYAAAVFSRTDAWAFGELFHPASASLRPYVVRFTGRRWLRVPSPVVPQDAAAVAPDDIWTVGPRPKLRTVLADSGYVSEDNFARADTDGLRLLAPLAKDPGRRHHRPPKRARHLDRFPATVRAKRRLRHPRGRDDYKLRARLITAEALRAFVYELEQEANPPSKLEVA